LINYLRRNEKREGIINNRKNRTISARISSRCKKRKYYRRKRRNNKLEKRRLRMINQIFQGL